MKRSFSNLTPAAEEGEIDITPSVMQHFADIGHDPESHTVVYENAQARMRTTILMDVANMVMVVVKKKLTDVVKTVMGVAVKR